MNENAKAWVAALRSHEYRQGQDRLRIGDKFCVLGVGWAVAEQAGVPCGSVWSVKGLENAFLPEAVADWLGLRNKHGGFYDEPRKVKRYLSSRGAPRRYGRLRVFHSLADLNDAGVSFDELADLIESEPAGLFV